MTWQTGRDEIEGMISQGELAQVVPSDELADRFFEEADRHLASARAIRTTDPTGSYQLAYDAARKACAALLAVQGLRATSAGGHIAVQDVVRAQFRGVFAQFPTLRRVRKQSSTPTSRRRRPRSTMLPSRSTRPVTCWTQHSGSCSPGASTRSDLAPTALATLTARDLPQYLGRCDAHFGKGEGPSRTSERGHVIRSSVYRRTGIDTRRC